MSVGRNARAVEDETVADCWKVRLSCIFRDREMSGPFTLKIVRPYASREDFLQGDYWTVSRSEMLLLGVEGVAEGAQVTFEIVLESREVVVRGEGRALEIVGPSDERPGGVRVRFKQLDASSKATLRRCLETQKKRAAEMQQASTVEAAPVEVIPAPPVEAQAAPQPEPEREEPSGVHHRIAGPVRAPENRDALLERLRERSRLRKGVAPIEKSTAAAE
jgi:hypothetical protein